MAERMEVGWKVPEFPVDGSDSAVRIAQLEETVEIAKRLWAADHVTYEGKQYRVQEACLNPKPSPLPPS